MAMTRRGSWNPLDFPRGSLFRLKCRLIRVWSAAKDRGDLETLRRADEILMLVDDAIYQYTGRY